ncbi:Rrf2 family transcriptional regulator [Prolixibacter sp. NT017]|uniref:RrF2 family transcriptional regulator n=1 Tax=Prolixibacter sp. NT017 TaxID=2652390 RepID=UPI00126F0E15|nr:Rrf2 family transcriptional regulator [Prolixibacter sp. NT017]GET25784.1 Rrf2 family transcriptional regulator [Prolixibacter sp. NT017]
MKFTSKFHGGIKALVDIALYDEGDGVLLKDIAQRNCLSVRFLDQIVASLRKNQLIFRNKGYRTGYRLTRAPNSISLYDVYIAFEGKLDVYHCVDKVTPCAGSPTCATHFTLENLNKELTLLLRNQTIGEVCQLQAHLNHQSELKATGSVNEN